MVSNCCFYSVFVFGFLKFGWFESEPIGHRLIQHNGATLGHYSLVSLFPDSFIGVFASNTGSSDTLNQLLSAYAFDLRRGDSNNPFLKL